MPKTIPFGANDKAKTIPFGSTASTLASKPDTRDWLQKASDFVIGNNLPGAQLGQTIGESLKGLGNTAGALAKGDFSGASKAASEGAKNVNARFGRTVGDVVQSAALPASIGLAAPASVGGAIAQYGTLGAAQAGGSSAASGNDLGQVAKDTVFGGAIGGATGGIFNLVGKGINLATSKVGPTAASVTSGVPKAAIEQARVNPQATKEGIKMSVNEVRSKATASLQTLYNDLNSEFSAGTKALGDTVSPQAGDISQQLIQKAQNIAKEFKVSSATGAKGLVGDFSKSSIVKGAEESAVQKAFQTISTWDDFSPQGLQTLNQRVNALKDFDSGGITKSSAIIGKIHNAIGDVIKTHSPELAALNENYSKNRKVLDEIGNILGVQAKKPTQIQASVTRLDNIFKENRDEYINIIRELGRRSGVDYLSLLAGGEFQRLLPGYIRSAVAVGSIGGIGTVASNPLSLLLLPLFSPRAVGFAARNAPAVGKAASQLSRSAATQAIPAAARSVGGSQEK